MTGKKRREYLATLELDIAYPLEELILDGGFPESCTYSSYWTGSGPGARMAYELGCKVIVSKLLQITLTRMSESEIKMREIQLKQKLDKSRERNKKMNELRSKIMEDAIKRRQ